MQSGRVRVLGKPLDVVAPRFLLSCWVASVDYITVADVKTPLDFAYKYGIIDKQYDARAFLSEFVPMVAVPRRRA